MLGIWNFAKAEIEQVDAVSILWQVLKLNKVEEVKLEMTVACSTLSSRSRYEGGLPEANFKFAPKSKSPLLYEPVTGDRHWNINGNLYYPGNDVKDLLYYIAKDEILYENKLEPYCKYDCGQCLLDFVVTFVTKNNRVWVDQIEV